MKRLLLLIIPLLFSCSKDDEGSRLDPNAMISIRPAQGVQLRSAEHLTALEIVEQTNNLCFYNYDLVDNSMSRGFSEAQRDTVGCRLLMWGTDIIKQDGNIDMTFIGGEDMILQRAFFDPSQPYGERGWNDTIGYLPNSALIKAREIIIPAFERGDYETVYKAFDEAFVFYPITGAEWRELKAQGKN